MLLTVATIGLAQLLGFGALILPRAGGLAVGAFLARTFWYVH